MMKHCTRILTSILAIAFTFSTSQAQERKISRSKLPPAVEKTVAAESAGATIKGFASEIEHGQKFYEASLIVNGHTKDILIDKHGNIVEVEEQVTLESLSQSVQDGLKTAAGSGTIENIESITKKGHLV